MRPRSLVPLCLLAVAALPASAGASTPILAAQIDTVRNVDSFTWSVPFVLRNMGDSGLYVDSLILVVKDLDPGETRSARESTTSLDMLARNMLATSPGDSSMFDYSGPATAEFADLTFRLRTHDAHGHKYVSTVTVPARGGVLTDAYPSRRLDAAGGIEIVELGPSGAVGAAPGVLLLHDRGESARKLLPRAYGLTRRGYGVVIASLPGYGTSAGAPDAAGPASVAAVSAALGALRAVPGVDSTRVAIWGRGLGATTAALFAADRADVRGVILQGASYDAWATARAAGPRERAAFVADAGRDSAAWAARSPSSHLPTRGEFLVLHGAQDAASPAASAREWADRARAAGAAVQLELVAGAAESLPAGAAQRLGDQFLRRVFAR